ncbi:MAG: 4-hydroxyphenylacetate decarboxylase small subunit [Candidatus Bipolaricaulota bacterium]
MSTSPKHLDCRNYAAVDVVKGICHRTKGIMLADDDACESFELQPRCRDCRLYTPGDEEFIGTCGATTDHPMTYPDLVAMMCEWFVWKDG